MVEETTKFPIDNCRDCMKFEGCSIREALLDMSVMIEEVDITSSICDSYEEDTTYMPDKEKWEYVPTADSVSTMDFDDEFGYLEGMTYWAYRIDDVSGLHEGLEEFILSLIEDGYDPTFILMNQHTMEIFAGTKLYNSITLLQIETPYCVLEVREMPTMEDRHFAVYAYEEDETD